MNPPSSLSENSRGILLVLGASVCFILTDTCVKLASADLSIGQIIVVRSLISLPVVALIAMQVGAFGNVAWLKERVLWLRSAGELGATLCYLTALARIDIANATAVLQLIPLAVTGAAAIFLGEKVGIRRWTAIVIGLGAVILIIRPGLEGFSVWSLAAVATVGFVALRDLCSRRLPPATHPLAVACLSLLLMIPLGLLMLPFSFWAELTTRGLLLCAASGLLLAAAYVMITQAMRHGEIAVVSPFRYVILLFAIVVQIVVFAVWPDALTLLGGAILVATGLYTLYRERQVNDQDAERASEPAASSAPR